MTHEEELKNELKVIALIRNNLQRLPSAAARGRVLRYLQETASEEEQLAAMRVGTAQAPGDEEEAA